MATSIWQREDSWAILLGSLLLLLGLLFFYLILPDNYREQLLERERRISVAETYPLRTVDYWLATDEIDAQQARRAPAAGWLHRLTATPAGWTINPLQSLFPAPPTAEAVARAEAAATTAAQALAAARAAEAAAQAQQFNDGAVNAKAAAAIAHWREARDTAEQVARSARPSAFHPGYTLLLATLLTLLLLPASRALGDRPGAFVRGFALIMLVAVVAQILGAQRLMKTYGIGDEAWAIALGLLISNTVGVPSGWRAGLRTELLIKIGLVLLGAEVLLNKILAIGLPGIFVSWIVTPIVLVTTFWFGQRILGIASKTLNITVSADMSVCGVSAAVATAAACGAKKEELTLAIGLSMVFTSIMMIVQPIVIHALGMPEVLGGAWIGGTIDSTGAVVAAGAFLGETALSVAATIKMIQNILIGFIAFGVAIYFSRQGENGTAAPVGWQEIWHRFPKFILGFLGASLFFSFLYELLGPQLAYTYLEEGVIGGFTKNMRGWFFVLAFAGIGLSTNFRELRQHFSGGKPLVLYVCGQGLNLLLTLLMAYLMFYVVFPEVTAGLE